MTDRPCPPNIAPEIWAELCAAKDAIRARKEAKDKAAFGNGAAGEEWPDKEDIPIDDPPRRPKGKVEKKQPQANRLIELAADAQLFHAPDSVCFADIGIDGHRETWAIRSKGFRRWLVQRYFEEEEGAPNSDAVQTALGALEAKAQFKSPLRQVCVRIGALNDRIYLDLCDEEWRSVEIGPGGWHIVQSPPVRFRRPAGMQPLPEPQRGGSIETLRSFLNVNPDGFTLGVAWILAALRDRGPYPILALAGEHGSAKSTFSAILRSLIDPNIAPLRALPREDRDLFIAATNGHLLCFDNVSGLPAWISDTLCRLATGGGFAVRQLYTDQDEVLFDACRPAILNGIEDIVTRPDLAERSLFLTLQPIMVEQRRAEKELYAAFEQERPFILGALLDAVAHGLKQLPDTRLGELPRMADFALWVAACETAMWPAGTFAAAYKSNLDEAIENVAEADLVSAAVRVLVSGEDWSGTATELMAALAEKAGERTVKAKEWPGNPRALSGRLRRAAPLLRKLGIEIDFGEREGKARNRTISIHRPENGAEFASAPSFASAYEDTDNSFNDFVEDSWRTQNEQKADAKRDADFASAVQSAANPLQNKHVTATGATDAKKHTQSGDDDDDAFSAQLAALRAENDRVYAAARKAKK